MTHNNSEEGRERKGLKERFRKRETCPFPCDSNALVPDGGGGKLLKPQGEFEGIH